MSDLISRQSAIEALNGGAELLRRVLDDTDFVGAERAKFGWGLELIESCISDVKELPSAQLEIIRCKDCENYQTDWQPLSCDDGHYCAMVDTIMPYDGFCHMGERREDEQADI